MSSAVSATGTLVKRALLASPTVFTTITEVTKATIPAFSRNKLDTTTHNDGTESNQLGILRQADGGFTLNYIGADATHASVLADMQGNVKNQWQFLLPSGITYTGPARVQQCKLAEATVDAIQMVDVILTWAGPVIQA